MVEDDEKRSELLGGAGKVLSNNNDKYLDQTVLDLQFGRIANVQAMNLVTAFYVVLLA